MIRVDNTAPIVGYTPGLVRDVPFARVDCSGNEKKYVSDVIDSGWLTTASKAMEFEKNFAKLLGVKHAIAVNSCTAALHLSLDATGVNPSDGVFVPSFTFTASAEVIRYMGADPIVLDVDPITGALTPEILADAIKKHPNVKHMVAVHFGGKALEMTNATNTGILEQCRNAGIRLIEDAAHALPCRHNGSYVGTFGELTCFSFYANKTMTTGEGGMVTTDSDELAERVRLMRLHGIDRDVWKRFTSNTAGWEYDVLAPGFKYNMPDISAAVGLAQLERLEEMRYARQLCAEYYFEHLSQIDEICLVPYDKLDEQSWHLFPLLLTDHCDVGRNTVIERLNDHGIGVSVHYKPIHRLRYYKERYELDAEQFPGAEFRWHRTFSLPIYNLLGVDDLAHVVSSVKNCVRG